MFNGKVEATDIGKLPNEYRDLLLRLLTIQADCEIGGPHLYVRSLLFKAPTAEDQWRVTRMAAEEIDHFRKFNNLLKELEHDRTDLLFVANRQRYLETFRGSIRTWADFSAFSMLVDRVGKYQAEEFTTSSYLPATRILAKILVEEEGHIAFGVAKMRALCATPEGKRRAQAALEHWFPRALDMFGHSESRRSERFMEWGLKHRTNAEQRRQYLAEVQGVVAEMGLALPDPAADRHYE